MPNTHSTLTSLFTDIASAIREKDGSSSPIVADAFPSAIRAIPSGGGTEAEDNLVMRTISEYTNARISMIGTGAFYSCQILQTASFPICTSIGKSAFCYDNLLKTISFPMCKTINNTAFFQCSRLTSALFPACTKVSENAFFGCNSLTTISFPVCTSIGSGAFGECWELTTASFPACKSIIGSSAFAGCRKLISLFLCASSVCVLSKSNAFNSTPIGGYTASTGGVYGSVFVPMSLLSAYQSATNWTYFSSRIVGVNPEDM